jgi:FAD/FMN-containing dehydrogenase
MMAVVDGRPGSNANGVQMCEKCVELDGKIEHYQRLSSKITDQLTLDGIKELIERMKAQKAVLHPEQEQ